MNEIVFRNWATKQNIKKKVLQDACSRIKKVERALSVDVDVEYTKDNCVSLFLHFSKCGQNDLMKKANKENLLPVGKYHLSAYKYAIKLYTTCLRDNQKASTDLP